MKLDSQVYPKLEISNFKVDNTYRTSVNVSLSVSVPSTIYYGYFLAGSPALTAEDVINQETPEYSTTKTFYGF